MFKTLDDDVFCDAFASTFAYCVPLTQENPIILLKRKESTANFEHNENFYIFLERLKQIVQISQLHINSSFFLKVLIKIMETSIICFLH